MPSPKYGYRPEPVEGTLMESSSLDIIAPAAKAPASPEPVVKSTVCSLCEFAWDLHGDNPTTDDCIRLLKAEMQRMKIMERSGPIVPYYPQPAKRYPDPGWPRPNGPIWYADHHTLNIGYGDQIPYAPTVAIGSWQTICTTNTTNAEHETLQGGLYLNA